MTDHKQDETDPIEGSYEPDPAETIYITVDGGRWRRRTGEVNWEFLMNGRWEQTIPETNAAIHRKYETGDFELAPPEEPYLGGPRTEEIIHIIINGFSWRKQPRCVWEYLSPEHGWITASQSAAAEAQIMFEAGEYTMPYDEPAVQLVPEQMQEGLEELKEYGRQQTEQFLETRLQLKQANERAEQLTVLQVRQTHSMEEIAHVAWLTMGILAEGLLKTEAKQTAKITSMKLKQEYRTHRAGTRTLLISSVANLAEVFPHILPDTEEGLALASQIRDLRFKILAHLDSEQLNKIYGSEPTGTEPETVPDKPETGGDQATSD